MMIQLALGVGVLLVFLAVFSIFYWSWRNGITPVPTSRRVKKVMLSLAPDLVQGKVYELGVGWGTLLLPFAQKYPLCQVVGWETSPIPYWVTRLRLWWLGTSHIALYKRNFFEADLKDASLIICYLYTGAMQKLSVKLEHELQEGAWVITHTFRLPGWVPVAIQEADDLYHTPVYLYRKEKLLKEG